MIAFVTHWIKLISNGSIHYIVKLVQCFPKLKNERTPKTLNHSKKKKTPKKLQTRKDGYLQWRPIQAVLEEIWESGTRRSFHGLRSFNHRPLRGHQEQRWRWIVDRQIKSPRLFQWSKEPKSTTKIDGIRWVFDWRTDRGEINGGGRWEAEKSDGWACCFYRWSTCIGCAL